MMITAVVGVLLCSSVHSYDFAGGVGQPDNPFKISTAAQLIQIGSDRRLLTKSYVLENDIDLDPDLPGGRVFSGAVISADAGEGSENPDYCRVDMVDGQAVAVFSGRFYGNGHAIRNMVVDSPDGRCVGLFGYIGEDAVVSDLRIEDGRVSGQKHVGLLAGINHGTVSHCSVSGSVTGNSRAGGLIGSSSGHVVCSESEARVEGEEMIGGLIGHALAKSSLTGCRASCDVRGRSNAGGLIGQMLTGMAVNCRASGKVSSETNAGGLIGGGPYGGTISMCEASARVQGTVIGGLVGIAQQADIGNSYAAGALVRVEAEDSCGDELAGSGGLVGYWKAGHGHIVHCFWDRKVSGTEEAVGGIGSEASLKLTLTKGVDTMELKAEASSTPHTVGL